MAAKTNGTALVGMKEICGYMRRSEATVLELIRDCEFPAKKIRGCWESDTGLIDRWRREQITGQAEDVRQVV